jgi:glycopeptide antibiotics resistance protein
VISQEQPTSGSSLSLKLLGLLGLAITMAVVYFYLNPDYPMKQSIANTLLGDKIIHLFSFGLLMYSFSLFWKQGHIRILLGICFVLLGVGLEMLQAPMGGGQFEFGDIIANTFGVAIGYLFTKFHTV